MIRALTAAIAIDDRNRRWWILGATSGVLGLIVLDETVVGVALATIRADLETSQVTSHWIVNAYLLTFTCFVAVGGRLGDRFGLRDPFLVGLAIFATASLAAGFALGGGWLVAARAAQGIGAAIMFPACWAILTRVFPPDQRGLAFGIQTTVGGVFMAAGPLVGGFFAEVISWRWIFWVNLPIVLVIALVMAATWTRTPENAEGRETESRGVFDAVGLITLVGGLTALAVALMEFERWGWTAPATLALFCAGIVLLGLFVTTELRKSRPLIELRLLRIPTFAGGNLVFFTFQFDKIAVFVFVPLFLQHGLDGTPIEAGLALVIAIAPTLITSLGVGRLSDRYGARWPLLIGLLMNGAAVVLIGLIAARVIAMPILWPLVVWGATLPFISVAPRRALMSAVPRAQQGQASGVNLTIQMLGGTVAMAVCGTLLAATGSYGSLFLLTGALIFVTWIGAWLTVERPQRDGQRAG